MPAWAVRTRRVNERVRVLQFCMLTQHDLAALGNPTKQDLHQAGIRPDTWCWLIETRKE